MKHHPRVRDTDLATLDTIERDVKALLYVRSLATLETELLGHVVVSMSDQKAVYEVIAKLYHRLDVCLGHLNVKLGTLGINPHLEAFRNAFVGLSSTYLRLPIKWYPTNANQHYRAIQKGYRRYVDTITSDPFRIRRRSHTNVNTQRRRGITDSVNAMAAKHGSTAFTVRALTYPTPNGETVCPVYLKETIDTFLHQFQFTVTTNRRYKAYYRGFIARLCLHLNCGPYWTFVIFHTHPDHDYFKEVLDRHWCMGVTSNEGRCLPLADSPTNGHELLERFTMFDHIDNLIHIKTPSGFNRLRRSH